MRSNRTKDRHSTKYVDQNDRSSKSDREGSRNTSRENTLTRLQQTAGNQAVQRLMQLESEDFNTARLQSESTNRTGMPDSLKKGLETFSGMDLSDVRVHRNSSKPGRIKALACTKGRDIYLAPRQEEHLPHEGWHVVQQFQGNVESTTRVNGYPINDDSQLEQEADVMGSKASRKTRDEHPRSGTFLKQPDLSDGSRTTIQRTPDARSDLLEEMADDVDRNIGDYNTGMNSAVSLFESRADDEISDMSTEDQSKQWTEFGLAVASLTLPALAPHIGLSATAVSLITGGAGLAMDPVLNEEKSKEEELNKQKAAVKEYFIGTENSVQTALAGITPERAANSFLTTYEGTSTLVSEFSFGHISLSTDYTGTDVRNQLRAGLQHTLFDDRLVEGRRLDESEVTEYILERMMRLWHLSTVTTQAMVARSESSFISGGESVDAFVNKVMELFPDLLPLMEKHMPDRYHYWMEEKEGRMNNFEVLRFRDDVRRLSDIVRKREFGVPRQIKKANQPAVWPASR